MAAAVVLYSGAAGGWGLYYIEASRVLTHCAGRMGGAECAAVAVVALSVDCAGCRRGMMHSAALICCW